jgi:predicted Zn-dependent protease
MTKSDARAGHSQQQLDAAFAAVMAFGANRKMEAAADRVMVQLQVHAGYDPCALQSVFAKLLAVQRQYDPVAGKTHLFDTHPATPERLHAIEAQLRGHKCNATDPGASERYRVNVLDRLPAQ